MFTSTAAARGAGLFALTLTVFGGMTAGSAHAQTSTAKAHKAKPAVTPATPKFAPNVVATVNGRVISRDDLLGLFDTVHGRPLVTELIKDALIEDAGRKMGVSITDAELSAAIQNTRDQIVKQQMQRGNPMTYAQFAAQNGITDTFLRWSVYEEALRNKVYAKSLAKDIPPLNDQIKVAHILIATIPLGGEEPGKATTDAEQQKKDADAKVKIEGILADIKSNKITFEDAAKQYSADQSNAKQGGLLPYAARNTFDPTFEAAAWDLKNKGDISGPVKSKFGWHLIKLISRGSQASAAEKQAYLADQMQRIDAQAQNPQAVQAWITSLMQSAKISVNPAPVIVPNPKSPLSGANIVTGKKTASK